jgi:hypothetical protein
MGSKFFGNKNDNRETNGKRLFKGKKSKSKNKVSSSSNAKSKAQSKGFTNSGSSGVRKVGRGG